MPRLDGYSLLLMVSLCRYGTRSACAIGLSFGMDGLVYNTNFLFVYD